MILTAYDHQHLAQLRLSEDTLRSMSWRELAKLSSLGHHAIYHRVTVQGMSYQDAVYKAPETRASILSKLAKEHSLNYATLASRKRRNPNTPLEVLAKMPVLDKYESSNRANDAKRKKKHTGVSTC